MPATSAPINLDKLRNAVQKFGKHTFTTAQLAQDYLGDEVLLHEADTQYFETLLRRHAALLGVTTISGESASSIVWQAI